MGQLTALPGNPNIGLLAAYPGKYENFLYHTMQNKLDVAKDITVINNVVTTLNMTKLSVNGKIRPYRETFDGPDDDLNYSPRKLDVHLCKRDLSINPLKYRDNYFQAMMRPGVNPDDIPFEAYTWQKVIDDVARDVNDSTAYFGVRDNAGTDPADCADGLGTIIATEVLAGNLVPVTTGAITNTTAYAQFKQVFRDQTAPYRNMGVNIYCSYDSLYKLFDDFENRVTKYVEIDPLTNEMYLATTNRKCKIVPATWMLSSQRLICTPKDNLIMGTDLLTDMSKVHRDVEFERLRTRILFNVGFQIRDLEAVTLNEQV